MANKRLTTAFPVSAQLLGLGLLAAGMIRILWGLLNCVDVPFGDDSMYLAFSRQFPKTILPDYGPLYVAGYKIFSLLTKDALVAYRMGMFAHVLIPTIALYFAALNFRLHPVLAAIIAVSFLGSPWILDFGFFNPMVSHPAIAWIFIWAAWVWRKPAFTQLLSALLLCLVVVYYRPEHVLSMLLIAGLLGVWLLYRWRERVTWKRVGLTLAILVLIAGTFKIIGKPVGNSGKRSGLAFLQHVAINYLTSKGDPQAWENHVYFTDYLPEMLGYNTTLEELPSDPKILFENSKPLLITHVSLNIKGFLHNCLLTPSLLLPSGTPHVLIYILDVLLVFLVLWLLFRHKQALLPWWQYFTQRYGIMWLILLCFVATSIAVSVFIYPRVHYFLFVLPFFYFSMYLLGKWLILAGNNQLLLIRALLPVIAVGYIIASPNVCSKAFMKVGGPDKASTHIPAIETLWKMDIRDSVRILDRQMGIFLYMPANYRYVDFNMDRPFMQYIDSTRVNMIHETATLMSDHHFTDDQEFGFFMQNLDRLGWQRIPIPGTEHAIVVKKELVQ